MTADMYDSDLDEEEFGSLLIDLTVTDHLRMYVLRENGDSATFILPPNDGGLREAKSIIETLNIWIQKIEESRKQT